jgi:hypothetical protein
MTPEMAESLLCGLLTGAEIFFSESEAVVLNANGLKVVPLCLLSQKGCKIETHSQKDIGVIYVGLI